MYKLNKSLKLKIILTHYYVIAGPLSAVAPAGAGVESSLILFKTL